MTSDEVPRVVSASRDIEAGLQSIFDYIADPSQQPQWDGNDNLAEAPAGQRVRRVGDVFTMTTTRAANERSTVDGTVPKRRWNRAVR